MKKRTYSKAQSLYMVAKANLETAEKDHNAAETANADFSEIPEHKELWERILEARKILKDAEQNLLDYALNVVPVPAKEKAVLTEAVKTNYTTRQKVIDLVLNLDAATVPAR